MLDFRHETFLTLCATGSYTKAAKLLHITQPAVTQHIQFLERVYGGKLFGYEGKTLVLTERGENLRTFAMTVQADVKHLQNQFADDQNKVCPLIFGATLTIGEHIMPPILGKLMKNDPDVHITMLVSNTEVLMQKLRDGAINFALVEGFFDKNEYESIMFSLEPFIPVCSPKSVLAAETKNPSMLLNQRLILREKGSGTREAFEILLREKNLTTGSFAQTSEIGNMSAIKQLVAQNAGIAFLYQAAVEKELIDGSLCKIPIKNFSAQREFNFVFLKNSRHRAEYEKWLALFKNTRSIGGVLR